MTAHYTPDIVKEPSVKLASGIMRDRSNYPAIEEAEMNSEDKMNSNNEKTSPPVNCSEKDVIPKNSTPMQLEEILEHQKKEEKLLEEQHELLQKKLLHDYDNYIKDLGAAQEKQVDLEIVNGDLSVKKRSTPQEERKTMKPTPVGTYDLSEPEVIPSYSIMYSGSSTGTLGGVGGLGL